MKTDLLGLPALLATLPLALAACPGWDGDGARELDTEFDIPRAEPFPEKLSAYGLYAGDMSALEPATGVHLYEIPSKLFTDHARKQRLVRVPGGQAAEVRADQADADYPDGAVVAKTFYYPDDFGDPDAGRRIIETRLLVKTQGVWNVATYIWDDDQADATLSLTGATTQVTWVDADGVAHTIDYEIPGEVACVTCHQSSGSVALLGLTMRNLNRPVWRGEQEVDQLTYLQGQGVFDAVDPAATDTIVDFTDTSRGLEERARAYLDTNCAHCHSPGAWRASERVDLDLRYRSTLGESGILAARDELERVLSEGRMPYVGTTVIDDDGVALVLEYLERL